MPTESIGSPIRLGVMLLVLLTPLVGCWAPLGYQGVPARSLPEDFRVPRRTGSVPLNLAQLTLPPAGDYLLSTNDVLDVTVPGLYDRSESNPLRVTVMSEGNIHLPMIGSVKVAGMNLLQVQQLLNEAYGRDFLVKPSVNVTLFEKSPVSVLVMGQVNAPGQKILSKYQNDVGRALAAAEGLTEDAADYLEIHKHSSTRDNASLNCRRLPPCWDGGFEGFTNGPVVVDDRPNVIRIPLRQTQPEHIEQSKITLGPGDVVFVPDRKHEVFFVVGKLNQTNTVRFTVGDRERELGVGFILPRDRDIDVVTAVAMAGYIDPIDSPTTVTVHRTRPNLQPLLITVDLIAARSDPRETILVQPGDIIYLNPDFPWWFRRTFDRSVVDLITIPYAKLFR